MAVPDWSHLKINPAEAIENIESYIRAVVEENNADGAVIGLSGGLDSAILTTVAVRVLGKERVRVYYLFDKANENASYRKARLMADWLGLELEKHDIGPVMRAKGIYSHPIMWLMSCSGLLNRFFNKYLHRFLGMESPFISTLRCDKDKYNCLRAFLYKWTVRPIFESFNTKHIYRRKFLVKRAEEGNFIVLGAANRSEVVVGWFVKDGIDDMPYSPLAGYYKTQLRQLAKFLGLPQEIQNQVAIPDMLAGVTDEDSIGVRYVELDVIFHGFDRGLSDTQIVEHGVSMEQIRHVRRLHKLSVWKRGNSGKR